jgi:hypothetical protein
LIEAGDGSFSESEVVVEVGQIWRKKCVRRINSQKRRRNEAKEEKRMDFNRTCQ